MTFLTGTRKIILKGVAIALAVVLVMLGGYKLFKKSPKENIEDDASINESTYLEKTPSDGCSNNNESKTLEVDLSLKTKSNRNADKSVADEDELYENKSDVVANLVPKFEGAGANNVKMDTASSSIEFDSSQDLSNEDSKYIKLSEDDLNNQNAEEDSKYILKSHWEDADEDEFCKNTRNVVNLVPKFESAGANNAKMDTTSSSIEFDSSQDLSNEDSKYIKLSEDDLINQSAEEDSKPIVRAYWADIFADEMDIKYKENAINGLFEFADNVVYVKTKDGKKIKAGTFYEYKVEELKDALEGKEKIGGGKISAIGIKNGADLEFVDVSCLQANSQYANNTVFVLMSGFNILETGEKGINDDIDNNCLYLYAGSNTSSALASISAPATTFYRRYGIFRSEANKSQPFEWKQRNREFVTEQGLKPKQINLLEDLGIKTRNGYVYEEPKFLYYKIFGKFKRHINNSVYRLPEGITIQKLPNNDKEAYDKFKIAYFSNCQVVYKNNLQGKLDKIDNENQCIDQAFISALDFNNIGKRTNKQYEMCAKRVIKAQYEAVFRAAILNNKKNVIIELNDITEFHNNPQWIIDALNELKDIIQDYGLNVIVNTFRSDSMGTTVKGNLIKLIKETGGNFMELRKYCNSPIDIVTLYK